MKDNIKSNEKPNKSYEKEKLRLIFTTTMIVDQFLASLEDRQIKVPLECAELLQDVKEFNTKLKKAFGSPKEILKLHIDVNTHYAWCYSAYTYLETLNFPRCMKDHEKFLRRELNDLEKLINASKENKG